MRLTSPTSPTVPAAQPVDPAQASSSRPAAQDEGPALSRFSSASTLVPPRNAQLARGRADVGAMVRAADDRELGNLAAWAVDRLHGPESEDGRTKPKAARLAGALIGSTRLGPQVKADLVQALTSPIEPTDRIALRGFMAGALNGVVQANPHADAETFAPLAEAVDKTRWSLANPLGHGHGTYRKLDGLLSAETRAALPPALARKLG